MVDSLYYLITICGNYSLARSLHSLSASCNSLFKFLIFWYYSLLEFLLHIGLSFKYNYFSVN